MKAAVYYDPTTIRYEEVPRPRAGPGEVVVRLSSVGLCGTDIHKIVHRTVPPGTVLGHEVAGTIAEVGEDVAGFGVGDRVYAGHHVPCFTCEHCVRGHHSSCAQFKRTNFDPGGFAEYFALSPLHVKSNLRRIPAGVTFDQAAMVEPVATVLRGMRRLLVRPGDAAVVMGAGPIGNVWAQALRHMGAGTVIVTDVVEARLRRATAAGATEVVDASREQLKPVIDRLTAGRGADVVVVAAGVSSLLQEAVGVAAVGGQVLAFAPLGTAQPIDASRFFNAEISILGAYSSVPTDFGFAMSLIEQGAVRVEPLVTHHLGLSQLLEAVRLTTDPGADALKIMLHPDAP